MTSALGQRRSLGPRWFLGLRLFLVDYARNSVNMLMLVIVPVVFVAVAAPSMAAAAQLLGGAGGGTPVETATAGWAAGFLAGIAMYFQVAAARSTDRRLVLAGMKATRLIAARLFTGLALAALVSAVALVTLAVRSGVDSPARVIIGTLMFAAVYVGLGALIGALMPNPVNGTVLILFVLIIDIFFGPTMIPEGGSFTRILPTHFISLWMVALPSGHSGTPGDLGWSLAWVAGSLLVAFAILRLTIGVRRRKVRRARTGSVAHQLGAVVGLGLRDWRRNPVFWILLAAVPAIFIWLSKVITPHRLTPMDVTENGRSLTEPVDIATIHAGTMTPIAIASLAMLAGVFIVVDAASADQRLHLAGIRTAVMLTGRLAVVAAAVGLSSIVALAVTAAVFSPHQWVTYIVANLLIAVTFGLFGVLIGPLFGRVIGAFLAFVIPFLDLGIAQSPMLRGTPPTWAHYLPGYAGIRVLVDASVTSGFDEAAAILMALGWITVLAIGAALVFRHMITTPARPTGALGAAAA